MNSLNNTMAPAPQGAVKSWDASEHLIATNRNELDFLILRTINVMLDLFNQGYAVVVSSS